MENCHCSSKSIFGFIGGAILGALGIGLLVTGWQMQVSGRLVAAWFSYFIAMLLIIGMKCSYLKGHCHTLAMPMEMMKGHKKRKR